MTVPQPTGLDLQDLAAVVKRAALARGLNSDAAEDVAQETLTRLWAVSQRLTPEARLPFALTTASNLIVDVYRNEQRDRKHQHRLVERYESSPELRYLAAEQAAAVRTALENLPLTDRQMLLDHAEGSSTLQLAEASRSTPSAIAARLARTRARLRLDYTLALRRVELPTVTCRRVLLAVSAADQRRQQALHAADHLGQCATCTELLPPLAERRSRLAGIVIAPLIALGTLGGRLHYAARNHAVQAAAGATVAAAAAFAVLQAHPTHPLPQSAAPAVVTATTPAAIVTGPVSRGTVETASSIHLFPLPASATLRRLAGQRVVVTDMAVQLVTSHPGFWIGAGNQRLYVHITNPSNIKTPVRVGQRVSCTAALQTNPAGFAANDGVDSEEGAAQLTRQGVHLNVQASDLVITTGGTISPAAPASNPPG